MLVDLGSSSEKSLHNILVQIPSHLLPTCRDFSSRRIDPTRNLPGANPVPPVVIQVTFDSGASVLFSFSFASFRKGIHKRVRPAGLWLVHSVSIGSCQMNLRHSSAPSHANGRLRAHQEQELRLGWFHRRTVAPPWFITARTLTLSGCSTNGANCAPTLFGSHPRCANTTFHFSIFMHDCG